MRPRTSTRRRRDREQTDELGLFHLIDLYKERINDLEDEVDELEDRISDLED